MWWADNSVAVVALAVSVVGGVGNWLWTNRQAKVAKRERWLEQLDLKLSRVIEVVQSLVTIQLLRDDISVPLRDLRVSISELDDHTTAESWSKDLREWLAAQQFIGHSVLDGTLRRVHGFQSSTLRRTLDSEAAVDYEVELSRTSAVWAAGLVRNLKALRVAPDASRASLVRSFLAETQELLEPADGQGPEAPPTTPTESA